MESSDRKNVYLTKAGDNSLNSGIRDTMIVGQTNMTPGKFLCFRNIYSIIVWKHYIS